MDVMADLSRSGMTAEESRAFLDEVASADSVGFVSCFSTCIMPANVAIGEIGPVPDRWVLVPPEQGRTAASRSLKRAAVAGSEWLVLTAPVIPNADVIGKLRNTLRRDPYFGCAIPRVSDHAGNRVALPVDGNGSVRYLSRRALAELPEISVSADIVGPCMLVRREVVANFEMSNDFDDITGALLEMLVRTRRVGYRPVVDNRAVVHMFGDLALSATVDARQIHRIDRVHADSLRARSEVSTGADAKWEQLLSTVFPGESNFPDKTLLIDARGMPAGFNGTTEFTLGMLDGLATCNHDWKITVMVNTGVEKYHNLSARYPGMQTIHQEEAGVYTVALRCSQPWHFSTMMELHRLALFNLSVMYDTIAWDTIYPAPRALEASWMFLAEHSDGVVYISDFTRRLFRNRFPAGSTDGDYVYYPSLDSRDYSVSIDSATTLEERYVLVVGNEYDHKNVIPTVRLLRKAFPFLDVRIFGRSDPDNPRAIGSIGDIPESSVQSMYRSAKIVVFPSFYEGFGFPMIRSLSCGKPVVVRDSELARELAGLYSGPGRLRTFSTPTELVREVGSLIHGVDAEDMPLGQALQSEPLSWAESSRQLLIYLEKVIRSPARSRWTARDRAIRQLTSYAG